MTEPGPPPNASRFHEAYETTPPWDIGRPQQAIVDLAEAGGIEGSVLEVGCGTGEHALLAAQRGHEAWGIDLVPRALEIAREKARQRGLTATFRIHDALDLGSLGRRFDTLLDVGVFHVFDDEDRARYVASLGRALVPGGVYHALVFSEHEPEDWGGPRRVRRDAFEESFAEGWTVETVREAIFETRIHENGVGGGQAWLATVRRQA